MALKGQVRGERNGKWKGGVGTVNDKGYLRCWHGENRGKYLHIVEIKQLLRNPISYMFKPGEWPEGMDVHHVDHQKQHNCHGNLMLISKSMHSHLSNAYRRYLSDHMEEFLEKVREENRWE